MNWDEFANWGKHISDWAADYHKTPGDRPVRAQTTPGEIAAQLPSAPPAMPGFQITTEPVLSMFSFRCPGDDNTQQRFVDALNADSRIYLTQGNFSGHKIIRFQVGQFNAPREDVTMAAEVIHEVWQAIQ